MLQNRRNFTLIAGPPHIYWVLKLLCQSYMGKTTKIGLFCENRPKTPLFSDFFDFFGHFSQVYVRDMENPSNTPYPQIL